jgi:hypothetical protein
MSYIPQDRWRYFIERDISCSPPPAESYYRNHTYDLSEEDRKAKRRRIEDVANEYIGNVSIDILTASLEGPFKGWPNPWRAEVDERQCLDQGVTKLTEDWEEKESTAVENVIPNVNHALSIDVSPPPIFSDVAPFCVLKNQTDASHDHLEKLDCSTAVKYLSHGTSNCDGFVSSSPVKGSKSQNYILDNAHRGASSPPRSFSLSHSAAKSSFSSPGFPYHKKLSGNQKQKSINSTLRQTKAIPKKMIFGNSPAIVKKKDTGTDSTHATNQDKLTVIDVVEKIRTGGDIYDLDYDQFMQTHTTRSENQSLPERSGRSLPHAQDPNAYSTLISNDVSTQAAIDLAENSFRKDIFGNDEILFPLAKTREASQQQQTKPNSPQPITPFHIFNKPNIRSGGDTSIFRQNAALPSTQDLLNAVSPFAATTTQEEKQQRPGPFLSTADPTTETPSKLRVNNPRNKLSHDGSSPESCLNGPNSDDPWLPRNASLSNLSQRPIEPLRQSSPNRFIRSPKSIVQSISEAGKSQDVLKSSLDLPIRSSGIPQLPSFPLFSIDVDGSVRLPVVNRGLLAVSSSRTGENYYGELNNIQELSDDGSRSKHDTENAQRFFVANPFLATESALDDVSSFLQSWSAEEEFLRMSRRDIPRLSSHQRHDGSDVHSAINIGIEGQSGNATDSKTRKSISNNDNLSDSDVLNSSGKVSFG